MLETPYERAKLIKAGIHYKTIEKLYIIYNNFKIVLYPMLFEVVEIDIESKGLTCGIDASHYIKQNSPIDFPHLVERFSMVGIPQLVHGFKLFRGMPTR